MAVILIVRVIPMNVYAVDYDDTNLVLEYGMIDHTSNTLYPASGNCTTNSPDDAFYIKIDSSQLNGNLKITFDRTAGEASQTLCTGWVGGGNVSDGIYDIYNYPELIGSEDGYYFPVPATASCNYVAELTVNDYNNVKNVNGVVYFLFGTGTNTSVIYSNVKVQTNAVVLPSTADLTNIDLSGIPSNYTFDGATYNYNGVTVANEVEIITVTPTGAGDITVDGTTVYSGEASAVINLTPGVEKIITVVVEETGKTIKTYTIKMTRQMEKY